MLLLAPGDRVDDDGDSLLAAANSDFVVERLLLMKQKLSRVVTEPVFFVDLNCLQNCTTEIAHDIVLAALYCRKDVHDTVFACSDY